MDTKSKVLVTGDFVIDHHIIKGNKSEASSKSGIGTFQSHTYGGAKLTFDLSTGFVKLIQQFIQDEKNKVSEAKTSEAKKVVSNFLDFEYIWPFKNESEPFPNNGSVHDSYIGWQITEIDNKGVKEQICSLNERIGFGIKNDDETNKWFQVVDNLKTQKFETIVIDEAGIGFRNHSEAWPDFEKADNIILKTTYPLCEGKLWDELMKYGNKLTTIVNLNQISHYNIKVSKSISWEQTALDIVYGLHNNKTLKNILNSNTVIVTIGSAGAIVIEKNKYSNALEFSLVYDPTNMEGEWEAHSSEKIINGFGLGSSFLMGFTASKSIKSLKLLENVMAGLKTMTVAMLDGVLKFKEFKFEPSDLSRSIQSPLKERKYYSAFIPDPEWFKMDEDKFSYLNNPDWSILENNYDNRKTRYTQKSDLFPLAFDLAQNGIDSIQYAPRLTIGKVTLFDRNEIENIRNIRTQIDFYDRYEDGKKPLNITVFGPPGAGKSFIVKELAKSMFEGKKTKPDFLIFNLSQFKDATELPGAYHAIRDSVLRGNLPIVFWDEFDSNEYEWLKSMIAPMQDGEFQEGREIHPIGKAIFIFAGGTTYTMQHFTEKMRHPDYIPKKGPDFISRISCSLNVFGPNRKPYFDKETEIWKESGDPKDICFSIRRALFIRQPLSLDKMPLNIDAQLLRALIEVSRYENGSRGLERLLKNLSAHKYRKIELSDLPSKEIISTNVDYYDFMNKLTDDIIYEKVAFEKMAVSIHNAWLEKNVIYSVFYNQYEDLSYDGRLDNMKAAERIGKVIAKSGKFMLILETDLKSKILHEALVEFDDFLKDNNNLEILAEEEHKGWMEARREANWKHGVRSEYHKTHNCLVAYNDLDIGIIDPDKQDEKNKDRNSIRKYTKMLKGSSYTITFQNPTDVD
jgi:hypothetical protein